MWHARGVSKARVIVHESRTAEDARKAVLALLAMGLDAESHRVQDPQRPVLDSEIPASSARHVRPARTVWLVSVAEEETTAAERVLADLVLSPDASLPDAPLPPLVGASAEGPGIWTWKHALASLAILAVCVAAHLEVHGGAGPSPRSDMIAAGAVAPWLVHEGQWWRLLTAVFLHFDLKHLVGNMSALLFLGPPLAARIGQLRLLLLFVATGVAGNLLSHVLGNEAAVKAGASGGICGLLGALAGVTIAAMAAATDARERRPAWQTLGALVALFGMMVGFEPGRDHYAHVGGLLAGVALGRLLGPSSPRSVAQEATGVAA